jgi:hypothetical protein
MLVERHKLGPFLGQLLRQEQRRHISAETQALINLSETRQADIADRCRSGFAAISDHFGRAGVPVVMLKGAALGKRLFGGAANRGYWDLDILVHERNRKTAGRLLEGLGYHRTATVPLSESLSALFTHGFDYESHDLKVDLHWCLSRVPGFRVDASAMMDRAVMFDVGGHDALVLNPEDELVFELISIFADIQRGGLRLQAFVDLHGLLGQLPGMEWRNFFARCRMEGCEAACRAVLGVFFSTLALGHEFPNLVACLGPIPSFEESLAVISSLGGPGRAKLWAARYMSVSPITYAVWWALSLPFRTAASHPSFKRRALACNAARGRGLRSSE